MRGDSSGMFYAPVHIRKHALGIGTRILEGKYVGGANAHAPGLPVNIALHDVRLGIGLAGDQNAKRLKVDVPVEARPAARVGCPEAVYGGLGEFEAGHGRLPLGERRPVHLEERHAGSEHFLRVARSCRACWARSPRW